MGAQQLTTGSGACASNGVLAESPCGMQEPSLPAEPVRTQPTGTETIAVSIPTGAPVALGPLCLDEATLALERLVEETHQSLVRDGLMHAMPAAPAVIAG